MNKFLRVSAALLCWLGIAFGVDWKALKPEGYVSDFAHVIDAQSKAQLESYGGSVERATGVQMALVTLQTLEGEPIEDVANTIFRAWGVGHKGKDDGIMLVLVTGDRRSRLEVGYDLGQILPMDSPAASCAICGRRCVKSNMAPRLWPLRRPSVRPSPKPRMYRSTLSCRGVCGLQLVIRFRGRCSWAACSC